MAKSTPKRINSREKYKISNWSSYNESLKSRGSLTIWFSEDTEYGWLYNGKNEKGGLKIYSDLAIEFCFTIRSLFRLPYRQTEGFIKSFFKRSKISLAVPSYTQFNRRTKKISIKHKLDNENIHIAVDSTGLKVYGEGEWKVRQHGWGKHRTWRKVHIGVNTKTLEIEAVNVTENNIDDASQIESLLNDITGNIECVYADGGYDKWKARKVLSKKNIKQNIPPQKNAIIIKSDKDYVIERNEAIRKIKEVGRSEWKKKNNYHKRSLAEVTMFRYKKIFTGCLQSRELEYEKKEVEFKCHLLNRMTQLGMPKSYKVAE